MASAAATASTPTSTAPTASQTPVEALDDPITAKTGLVQTNLVFGLCLSCATISFVARSYVRLWIKHTWILEDWLISISWLGFVACCALLEILMRSHEGEHYGGILGKDGTETLYWFLVTSILYGVVICVAKVTILLLYRRVFSPRRWSIFDLSIVVLIVTMVVFYIILCFTKIFVCTPRSKFYDPEIPGACFSFSAILNASGIFNTITDLQIFLLPVRAVWNLKLRVKKKILVILAFTFGLCAPAFSAVGLVVRLRAGQDSDGTGLDPKLEFYGLAECAVAIMCACFPEMAPLFRFTSERGRGRGRVPPGAARLKELGTANEPPTFKKKGGTHLHGAFPISGRIAREADECFELQDYRQYGTDAAPAGHVKRLNIQEGETRIGHEITMQSVLAG